MAEVNRVGGSYIRAARSPVPQPAFQLSDGQQHRLAVAMAVAGDPDLVLADEPTADLDPPGAAALADSILRLTRLARTFVVSSHDPVLTDPIKTTPTPPSPITRASPTASCCDGKRVAGCRRPPVA